MCGVCVCVYIYAKRKNDAFALLPIAQMLKLQFDLSAYYTNIAAILASLDQE